MTIPDNISETTNQQVSPKQDLYRYVNGTWLATHIIPADRSVDGTFHQLRDEAERTIRTIIETTATGTPHSRIGALYTSFMDEQGVEDSGLATLTPDLDPIRAANNHRELAQALGHLDTTGVTGATAYWIEKDSQEDVERAYLTQAGLGLPDEAYYREEQHTTTRTAYLQFIEDMLELTSEQPRPGQYSTTSAADAAHTILAFETRLAKGHWDKVTCRDANKTYNPTPTSELPTNWPFTEWLEATHINTSTPGGAIIIISQPSYLNHLASMATGDDALPLDTWKLWAYWRVITSRAALLPRAIATRNFDFYGRTLSGTEEQRARWKRAVALVENNVGEEVGRSYVAEHFPATHKTTMNTLVGYLTDAYRERIDNLAWMTPTTREKARAKLEKFRAKIGYPDTWRSFEGLHFSNRGADLIANVRAGHAFNHQYHISHLGKPSNKEEWLTTPQTVNAFYNPVKNDITFPAAILRPPFFDPEADMAGNFGAIGAVIGHEIGHGFDDQGSKYDGDGNLNSWWTDEDRAAFTQLTEKLIAQYDGLIPTGLKQRGMSEHRVNGALTLGENIGDLGGLGIAVVALRRYLADQGLDFDSAPHLPVDGLTESDGTPVTKPLSALQRLFVRWARIWQTAIRPQMAIQYVSIDPHSPAEFRCNTVCSNIAEFYTAFDVQPGDGMWLDEEARVTIW